MGLQAKAGLFGGVGLLVLVGVLAFLGIRAVDKSTQRSLDERVLMAQTMAQSVDQVLAKALGDLEEYATLRSRDLEDGSTDAEVQALDGFYRWSQTFATVFLLDRDGKALHTQPPYPGLIGQPLADDPRTWEALENLNPHIASGFASGSDETRVFAIFVPVVGEDGDLIGVVGGEIDLSQSGVSALINPLRLGSTAYAEIVDEAGWVMATTRSPAEEAGAEETEYAAHFATLVKARQATQETCYRCHETGEGSEPERRRDVLAFAPLTAVLGGVAIRQSEDEALAASGELTRDLLLGGGIVFVLGVALIWLTTSGLVRPIVLLTSAARRISRGDFNVEITSNRRDELGELASTFDQMRLYLKDSLEQKEERARESEEQAQQLAALNAVAATVSRSLDLQRVLEDGLGHALQIMHLDTGGIWLKEGDPARLTLMASHGASPGWLEDVTRLKSDVGSSAVVLSVQANDPSSPGATRAFVHVPLVSKGNVLGAMVIASEGQRHFETRERDLLAAFGHQLGVGVENAQLFQESQRREKEAHTLTRIGMEVSRLIDLDKILNTVVDSARQLLGTDAAILSLWDEGNQEIYTKAVSGEVSPAFKRLRLGIGAGIAGRVLSLAQPVTSEDYVNDGSIAHTIEEDDLLRRDGFKAYGAVPLKIGEVVVGSLGVANRRVNRFPEREIDLLQQLANQAAVAIENARLYDQVEGMAVLEERQRIAREMHDSLGQVLAYLGLKLREMESLVASGDTTQAQEGLSEVRQVVLSAYDEVKDGILALRTRTLPQAGLIPMVESYVESFQHQTGVATTLTVADEQATRFSPRVAIQMVRVIQEALVNVRKHAHASRVDVRFEIAQEHALVTIEDDGVGFDMPHGASELPFHFGLQTMRERMESVGGDLTIESRPGTGTRVTARLPLTP